MGGFLWKQTKLNWSKLIPCLNNSMISITCMLTHAKSKTQGMKTEQGSLMCIELLIKMKFHIPKHFLTSGTKCSIMCSCWQISELFHISLTSNNVFLKNINIMFGECSKLANIYFTKMGYVKRSREIIVQNSILQK